MRKKVVCALLACALTASSFSGVNLTVAHAEETETRVDGKVNYARGGVATADKAPIDYWGPDKLIDGIVNRNAYPKKDQSRWSSEAGAPSWVQIDMTENRTFNEIKIAWENDKTRKFHIEMSEDGKEYTTIFTSEDKPAGHPEDTVVDLKRNCFGRFVKVTVDALIDGAYPSVSIYEIEILGGKASDEGAKEFRANYALNGTATASNSPIDYWGPDKLIDDIINRNASKPDQSRWSSEGGAPQWAAVDLGEAKNFDELLLAWEAGGKIEKFHIEASDDGKNWETIYTAEPKTEGYPADTYVYFNEPVNKRHVKVVADKMTNGAYPSVSMYEFKVIGTQTMNNVARKASVVSNGDENAENAAAYVNDGDLDTKWASTIGKDQKTLTFTFEEPKAVQSFILEWERKNAKDYTIEAMVDGNWKEVAHKTRVPKCFQDIINLDAPVETTQIRIVVDDMMTSASDRKGVVTDKAGVALHEVEMYEEPYEMPPRDQPTTVQDIANDVRVNFPEGSEKMEMPTVQEGYKIEFSGADYEEVLKRDGSVIKPIVDTEVVVNFKVTEEETGLTALTPDIKVMVKGEHAASESVNAKPKVIPELQQWFGTEGEFEVTESSKIVVDPAAPEFKDVAKLLADDYEDIMKKKIRVVEGTNPEAGDFYFTKANKALEKETYILDVDDVVTVEADQYTGSYWATRTILQILKQTDGTISKGIAKDYPKYRVRGCMVDVARLPIEMRFLKDIVKTMSWYKMNDFQIHLSDNVFGSTNGVPDYAGFRLESTVPNLTNTDVYYSKDEFRDFINSSKELGVNIVPEFDTPGHSGAYTRAWPDLARGYGTPNLDGNYLDIENKFDQVVTNMKNLFAEYATGENPVYPEGTVIHVGTDEYKRGNKEAFRRYQDTLLRYVRDDLGYTPRVWGSQTENNGTTPITVDGVQMNMWYVGYANPRQMYELGYDMINTNDGDQYIVPGAGYYYDYLSRGHIYGGWQPNVIAGYKVAAGDEQMLGGNFCVWNDKTGPKGDNGTSDVEIFDRMYHIFPTYGAKLWGDIKDYSESELVALSKETNYAPNSNPAYQVESKGNTYVNYDFNNASGRDHSGNGYDLEGQKNVSYEKGHLNNALTLKGGSSYVETPIDNIGLAKDLKASFRDTSGNAAGRGTKVDFWAKKDATDSNEEQILFESEYGTIKAVQKETGKFGFSRWNRDYSFDYTMPEDEWVHITLEADYTTTKLYVNGEFVSELARQEGKGNKWASMITPLTRIGSETNAFKGQIDELVITTKDGTSEKADYTKVDAAIEKVVPLIEKQYTADSWKALQDALNAVEDGLDKADQARVDAFAAAIEDAVAGLQLNEDAAEKETYTVTVKDGKIVGTDATEFAYNKAVTVKADEPSYGVVFAGWEVDGKIVSTEEEYTFFVSNDITLTAVYEEKEAEKEAKALLTNVVTTKRTDGKYDVKFVGQLVVPEGYTVKNAGLVWSSKDDTVLELGSGLKPTYVTKIGNTNQFSVTIKGMPAGKFLRGKIFATIEKDGVENTVYSVEKKAVTKAE